MRIPVPTGTATIPMASAHREFTASGITDGGEAGNRHRERAKPGPGVEADEDERADPGGQQARYRIQAASWDRPTPRLP